MASVILDVLNVNFWLIMSVYFVKKVCFYSKINAKRPALSIFSLLYKIINVSNVANNVKNAPLLQIIVPLVFKIASYLKIVVYKLVQKPLSLTKYPPLVIYVTKNVKIVPEAYKTSAFRVQKLHFWSIIYAKIPAPRVNLQIK